MKVFFRTIHLYLGLVAGIVIATICLTGATLVFEKEMQTLIYPERYQVAQGERQVSIARAITALQQEVPGANVVSAKVYSNLERSYELSYSVAEKKPQKINNKKGETKRTPEGRGPAMIAFVNPYTGKLISLYNHHNSFFFTVFSLHRWLLMGDTGKLITGISTSIFLFILITGIILWWPQNKRILKLHLKLKWTAGWKRLNHDFHIVVGFYAAMFLFTIAFTGLGWSYTWFNDGIYWITGSENKRPEPPLCRTKASAPVSFDVVNQAAQQKIPGALHYTVNAPRDSAGAYTVALLMPNAQHEKASDQLYYDQYSGEFMGQLLYKERNLGQRVRSIFYPIHVGSIGGLSGRIIAFLACLAGFTFPITGIILWISRLRQKNKFSAQRKEEETTGENNLHSKRRVAH